MSITVNDLFCGAGGSSIGLVAAGLELKLAANHWDRAIETHAANFPDAEHVCADVSNYDMRRLPTTDVLWASPICTEVSPAGGRRRSTAQLDLLEQGPIAKAGFERTRATFHDVIRAAEVHRFKAVIVENVVEVQAWELFDWWLAGMTQLGYQHQFVSVSSAHVGGADNPHAPQWRDRLYIVFTRVGIPLPDVEPRPLAWCEECDEQIHAVQSWKRPDRRRIGKYGPQYLYRCPNGSRCRHAIVEPYVLPAAAAIDWSDLGTRIGDRTRPLAAATMRRIVEGLRRFALPNPDLTQHPELATYPVVAPYSVPSGGTWREDPASLAEPMPTRTTRDTDGMVIPPDARRVVSPFAMNVNHGKGDGGRAYPIHAAPFSSRTAKIGDGIVIPAGPEPYLTILRNHATVSPVSDPCAAISASGNHHGMVVPPEWPDWPAGAFIQKHHGGLDYARIGHMTKDVAEPMPSVVARPNLSLVIPYRRGAAKTTGEPLLTLGTRDSAALVDPAELVDDCRFRMLKPREHLRAQRFPDTYEVKGNIGEQTMQAGNAVSSNVSQWLGTQLAKVLA